MKRKKAMMRMWIAHLNGNNPNAEMNKVMDKIYTDHKAEVKALKKRISDQQWKIDSQRCGGVR